METTLDKPEMTLIKTGESFKTFSIKAIAGMEMPGHHSTGEAVVVVQRGKAILKMPDLDYVLDAGASFIIPAGVDHSLSVLKDFKALAIMPVDSEIEFV